MSVLLVGQKNNIFTSTFVASTKTLSISNVNNFPLDVASLASVWDATVSLPFDMLQNIDFSYTYTNGLPVYHWIFPRIPTAAGDSDTLDIVLNVPQNQMDYAGILYTNGATV